jgi:hypothetical protein
VDRWNESNSDDVLSLRQPPVETLSFTRDIMMNLGFISVSVSEMVCNYRSHTFGKLTCRDSFIDVLLQEKVSGSAPRSDPTTAYNKQHQD